MISFKAGILSVASEFSNSTSNGTYNVDITLTDTLGASTKYQITLQFITLNTTVETVKSGNLTASLFDRQIAFKPKPVGLKSPIP